ncbi:hypothetical protein RMSM_04688 [Rhodopirellula maiorica SM1]|uniref:Uncharacterized protein n=1 Tax=Rhodopirellula maiorica SM1 TaxID=1265738 RepID=M5RSN4_9BACT|nr:hypothetical protein RMSM_04688 [Rhodopirellula maiorica SM1]
MLVGSRAKKGYIGGVETNLDFFAGQGLQLDDPHLVSSMSLGGSATG